MGYESLTAMETSSQVTNKLLLYKSLENSQSLLFILPHHKYNVNKKKIEKNECNNSEETLRKL